MHTAQHPHPVRSGHYWWVVESRPATERTTSGGVKRRMRIEMGVPSRTNAAFLSPTTAASTSREQRRVEPRRPLRRLAVEQRHRGCRLPAACICARLGKESGPVGNIWTPTPLRVRFLSGALCMHRPVATADPSELHGTPHVNHLRAACALQQREKLGDPLTGVVLFKRLWVHFPPRANRGRGSSLACR